MIMFSIFAAILICLIGLFFLAMFKMVDWLFDLLLKKVEGTKE